MKKKIIILSLFIIMLCGCKPINDMSLEEIIKNTTESNVSIYNKYRQGYKYYVPTGIDVSKNTEYNEILMSSKYTYYLYIDAVSYYNKVIELYEPNDRSLVSTAISYQDKYGYLEINEMLNGEYFVEIMYNYAKIEVMIDKKDINLVVSNCLIILTSIDFNDNILKTLLDEDNSQFNEYDFNIFETSSKDSEYLQAIQKDEDDDENDDIHDADLIN